MGVGPWESGLGTNLHVESRLLPRGFFLGSSLARPPWSVPSIQAFPATNLYHTRDSALLRFRPSLTTALSTQNPLLSPHFFSHPSPLLTLVHIAFSPSSPPPPRESFAKLLTWTRLVLVSTLFATCPFDSPPTYVFAVAKTEERSWAQGHCSKILPGPFSRPRVVSEKSRRLTFCSPFHSLVFLRTLPPFDAARNPPPDANPTTHSQRPFDQSVSARRNHSLKALVCARVSEPRHGLDKPFLLTRY